MKLDIIWRAKAGIQTFGDESKGHKLSAGKRNKVPTLTGYMTVDIPGTQSLGHSVTRSLGHSVTTVTSVTE